MHDVLLRFTSCGRCSYFLAGFELLHGKEAVQAAVEASDKAWLKLTCDPQVRRLVNKSYGIRVDIDAIYFEGTCPECQRPFILNAAHNQDQQPSLQINL